MNQTITNPYHFNCSSLPQISNPPSINDRDLVFSNIHRRFKFKISDFFHEFSSSSKSQSKEENSFGSCSSLLEIEIPFSITSIDD